MNKLLALTILLLSSISYANECIDKDEYIKYFYINGVFVEERETLREIVKDLQNELSFLKSKRKKLKKAVKQCLKDILNYEGDNKLNAQAMLFICNNEEHENYERIVRVKEQMVKFDDKVRETYKIY